MKVVLATLGAMFALATLLPDRGMPAPIVETAGCLPGFVWRQAAPGDAVCVGFMSRDRVALENRLAPARRDPRAGSGAVACRDGMVWREAVAGDTTCVPPRVRDAVRRENELAALRDRSFRAQATVSTGPLAGSASR